MPRYFIHMAFDGGAYHGWQVQPNAPTIQATLEKALTTLLGRRTGLTGAGRTDTGVHASCFVAHFDHPDLLNNADEKESPHKQGLLVKKSTYISPDSPEFLFRLNRFLPGDIVIYSIRKVNPDLHARFSATYRTYHYLISSQKPLFRRNYSLYQYGKPDLDEINKCCKIITDTTDFTSFSKLHTDVKTNNCKVSRAEWRSTGEGYRFEITADRFLRNMVRCLVGTLMDVGSGKIAAADFRSIAEARDRTRAGQSAPAHGLFLTDIGYEGYRVSTPTESWP